MNHSTKKNKISVNLTPEIVHIWIANLCSPQRELEPFYHILSEDEKEKTNSYQFRQHQTKYIITHGILRMLLAFYSNSDPEKLQYIYSSYGKPHLWNNPEITFNISYSNEIGIFAFGFRQPIGIDIEYIRPMPDLQPMTDLLLSEAEKKHITNSSDLSGLNLFYKFWTRKEALVKAAGIGLSYPVRQISVSLEKEEVVEIPNVCTEKSGEGKWFVYELQNLKPYEGVLATKNQVREIHYFDWASDRPAIAQ